MVNQGDIVIVDFDPSIGSEQKGSRPGVVVSHNTFHSATNGLAILVPITSTRKSNFPLHIDLDERTKTQGQIMCEQLKTMDIKIRQLKKVEELPEDLLKKTLKILSLVFK